MGKTQSPHEHPRTIFVLYELGHVTDLERRWRERPGESESALVVPLSLDIEAKLSERHIPFSSGRSYKKMPPDLLAAEDAMMTAFFANPLWAAYTYRGVSLTAPFLFSFRAYLQRVLYYGSFITSIFDAHQSVERVVSFATRNVALETAGVLARREVSVVVDCLQTASVAREIPIEIVPSVASRGVRTIGDPLFFSVKRSLFGLFLKVWNLAIATLSSRHPRILVSDYWRNIGPTVEQFKKAECIFLDRTEMRHIPVRMLLRYRMRFVHSTDFVSSDARTRVRARARELARTWHEERDSLAPTFSSNGCSFDTLLLRAADDLVQAFEKLMYEIEGTYALYEHLQPDVVVLRASVSGQTHFSVLPLVAKKCDIPSLEIQHGLEYLGTGSLSREHVAEYVATYGPLIQRELATIGYAPENAPAIGSPRFDAYHTVAETDSKHVTILCIAPDVRPFPIYDSYSAEDYFTAVAKGVRALPGAHVIIKLRAQSAESIMLRTIVENVFSDVPHTIAVSEPLPDLFARSTVVVSCYSTAILEALTCGMPVIVPALNTIDAQVVDPHFTPYRDAGALYLAHTQEELTQALVECATRPAARTRMRARAQQFLTEQFSFDGKASERCAALVTALAGRVAHARVG